MRNVMSVNKVDKSNEKAQKKAYFVSRDDNYRNLGFVYCEKHLTTWYDPKKFDKCYLCWKGESGEKD